MNVEESHKTSLFLCSRVFMLARQSFSVGGCLCFIVFLFFCFNVASAATLTLPQNNLGLIGYWSFNEGTGGLATDFSGGGFAGTVYGSPVWVDGKNGKAIYFDGINDYVHNTGSNTVEDITSISVWVKPDDDGGAIISSLGVTGVDSIDSPPMDGYDGYVIQYSGGILSAGLYAKTYDRLFSLTSAMSLGAWHHVVFEWSSGDSKLYIDNVLEDSSAVTFAFYDPSTIPETDIGRYNHLANQYFTGIIDDVRVYNRFITPTEINNLYIKQSRSVKVKAISNTNLISYYTMNEGSGSVVGDMSGSTNDGSIVGTPDWTSGDYGGGYNLTASSYIALPNGTANPTDVTISMWIKPTATYADLYFWGHVAGCSPSSQYWSITSGQLKYFVGCGSSVTGNTTLTLNQWYNVAITITASKIATMYLNGVADSTPTDVSSGQTLESIQNYIGAQETGVGTAVTGGFVVDDVRIYNASLSTASILNIYNQSGLAKINVSQNNKLTNGLVGMWSFNGPDISGVTAYDRSGQGNDGTLTGGAQPTIGKIGQAVSFDGTDDYVTAANPTDYTMQSQDMTISAWVKSDITGFTERGILQYGGSIAEATFQWSLNIDDGLWSFNLDDNGTWAPADQVNGTAVTNDWTHVAVAHKAGTSIEMFINGVSVGINSSIISSLFTPITPSLFVGFWGPGVEKYFDGKIDEVRIYNRALSASEIRQLYNMGK